MAASSTIVAAMKFNSGVLICADSQASDQAAGVRWEVEKLERIDSYPIVVGLSGSLGIAQRLRQDLNKTTFHSNMFKDPDLIRKAIDRCYQPIYQEIEARKMPFPLWGLSAFWAGDAPYILEHECTRDCSYHEFFHAIGSGSRTAYAIWRTLGGRKLSTLKEPKAILVALRILRTCVDVEMMGVSRPFSLWIISSNRCRKVSQDEIEPQMEAVDKWELRERAVLFDEAAQEADQSPG